MTQIVQIRCPKCNAPIFSKQVDNVFLCDSCGTMHIRDGGEAAVVSYGAGKFARAGDGDRVYLPIWAISVAFDISDLKIEGGGLSSLFGLLPAQSRQGTLAMYLPAYELTPQDFKDLAMGMTTNPPKFEADKLQPGVVRTSCVLTADQLEHLARFVFVTGVAEKPGVLQRLDYRLSVSAKSMLYLPYYKKGESYQPGY